MKPIDYQYIMLLSNQLEGFKQVGNNYNFRCPICGDSEKIKKKRRGWLLTNNESPIFYCHNCGSSLPLQRLLEKLNPILYREYLYDLLKGVDQYDPFKYSKEDSVIEIESNSPSISLDSIATATHNLPSSHSAVVYLDSRRIPSDKFKFIYWIDNIQDIKKLDSEDKYKIIDTDGRLVFPQFGRNDLIGLNCRSLKPNTNRRYLNFKFRNVPMIFGLFDKAGNLLIDNTKPVYITEGAIDSLFLENAIAVNGADLTRAIKVLGGYDLVFVPDNEPRNNEILKGYEKIINIGTKIVMFPKIIKGKDINEMVLNHGIDYVKDAISGNIYNGIKAKLKLSDWRRT